MELALEIRETANHLAECLDDQEKFIVLAVMKRFLPDNVATDDDLNDIKIAQAEYISGQTVSHNAIDWN